MKSGKPKLSAEDRRAERARDAELAKTALKNEREKDARKRRAGGYSLLVGPGGEQGTASPAVFGASI